MPGRMTSGLCALLSLALLAPACAHAADGPAISAHEAAIALTSENDTIRTAAARDVQHHPEFYPPEIYPALADVLARNNEIERAFFWLQFGALRELGEQLTVLPTIPADTNLGPQMRASARQYAVYSYVAYCSRGHELTALATLTLERQDAIFAEAVALDATTARQYSLLRERHDSLGLETEENEPEDFDQSSPEEAAARTNLPAGTDAAVALIRAFRQQTNGYCAGAANPAEHR